jgi:hypothetical protein
MASCTLLTWSPDRYGHASVYCRYDLCSASELGCYWLDLVISLVAVTAGIGYRVLVALTTKATL